MGNMRDVLIAGEADMIKGSCHCGAVQWESAGRLHRFANCHCEDCRKINGASFSSNLVMDASGFQITKGEEVVTRYESSPGKYRCFCSRCGSPVHTFMNAKPDIVILRVGTVDGDPALRPQMHIWVSAKAPWYEILDNLPQHPEGYVPPRSN